ncbi:MAG: hypothetical protein KJ968_04875 [Nanoarchaeota archaeon]|nr:hypothetical protein [Nanoarchaeota archaeon]
MTLQRFEEYIRKGIVKKQYPNRQRALSLVKESEEKKKFLEILLKNIPKEQMNANFVVDYCYDIIMELLRAKMFIDGYNAGNSHEAEVSYMLLIGFIQADARFVDEIRYYRNGTKYYGKILNREYAGKVLEFTKRTFPKLKNMLISLLK